MATLNEFEQREKRTQEEEEMAREQRGSCVDREICILFTMEQETDYNKI